MSAPFLTKLSLGNFTAFKELNMNFSPGINVLIGRNGTGKTHIMKLLYAACAITITNESFAEKIVRVFLPFQKELLRLVNRTQGSATARVIISRDKDTISLNFSNHTKKASQAEEQESNWRKMEMECAFIPVKEMLAHAPGFRSLYERREIPFDETYRDIIDRALLPLRKGHMDSKREKLLRIIQENMAGKVYVSNENFFLDWKKGNLEFSLVAEGLRKLALLWLLIQNETLLKGSVLFWDEPEANLNPSMMQMVVKILLELRRLGVQIFLATHEYVLLKEFDLQAGKQDGVRFHAFYSDTETDEVKVSSPIYS